MTNPTDERVEKPQAYSDSELTERRSEAYPHGADCICFNCSEVLLKIRRWLVTVTDLNRKLELAGLEAEVEKARVVNNEAEEWHQRGPGGSFEPLYWDQRRVKQTRKTLALAIKNRDAAQAGGERENVRE